MSRGSFLLSAAAYSAAMARAAPGAQFGERNYDNGELPSAMSLVSRTMIGNIVTFPARKTNRFTLKTCHSTPVLSVNILRAHKSRSLPTEKRRTTAYRVEQANSLPQDELTRLVGAIQNCRVAS